MIKVCELVKRRPGMSVEDFQTYWRETHGPIVSRIPGITRYVQSHPLLGGYRKGQLVYDGVAEVWCDDKDAMRSMATTAEFRAAKNDEPNFIDTDALIELVCDEHVIKSGAAPEHGFKSIEFLHFREDLAPADAQAYWRGTHGPIAAEITQVRRYVQSHVRLGAYERETPPACDGLAITWFDSMDSMRESADSPQVAVTRADESNFLHANPPHTLITKETVFVG